MDISIRNLEARAKQDALEYMPALPKQNTLEAWQAFAQELEAIEAGEVAFEAADSWDWVIYDGKALELCAAMPSRYIAQAEEMVCDIVQAAFERRGIGGVASSVAFWIVYEAISAAVDVAREELLELANGQIENLEGVVA